MSNYYSHGITRIASLGIFGAIGVAQLVQGISANLAGRSFVGLGIVFLGALSFLQPVLFQVPLKELFVASRAAAVGPRIVRLVLTILAITFVLLGLVCNVLQV